MMNPDIQSFLPVSATLLTLPTVNHPPAILFADLDGDDQDEIVALYMNVGETYGIVLKKKNQIWQKIAQFKGKGYNVTDLLAVPITNTKQKDVIIGWQVAGIWSELDIIKAINNGFIHILSNGYDYSKLDVFQVPNTETFAFALWMHDTGKAYRVEVFKWTQNTLIPTKEYDSFYFQRVVTYYENALSENPDYSFYWYYLADAYMKTKQWSKALAYVEKALQLPHPFPSKEELEKIKKTILAKSARERLHILSRQLGDVTGDGVPDDVYLTGERVPSSPYYKNLTLVIENGSTQTTKKMLLENSFGANPTVFLGNFTENRGKDMLVISDTGGSGGIIHAEIFSFINGYLHSIFNSNSFNNAYSYEVNYVDYYKVNVLSPAFNSKYIIDISERGTEYLSQFYDSNGMLKKPLQGDVSPLSGLYPIDYERDGIYELSAYQNVYGLYTADRFGFLVTELRWNGNEFAVSRQMVSIYGSELKPNIAIQTTALLNDQTRPSAQKKLPQKKRLIASLYTIQEQVENPYL